MENPQTIFTNRSERQLIRAFRKLDEHDQQQLLDLIQSWLRLAAEETT